MKRNVTLIVLSFFILSANAQTAENFIQSIHQPIPSWNILKNNFEQFKLNIKGNVIDTSYFLQTRVFATEFAFEKRIFKAWISYKDSNVLYIKIEEWRDDSGPNFPNMLTRNVRCDTSIKYVDTTAINELINPYNKMSHTDFTWKDLYEDSTSSFGSGCGFISLPTPSLRNIIRLTKNGDRASIIRLCKGFSYQMQAYGALGLYFLKRKGIILDTEEKNLLNRISQSDQMIFTCEGDDYMGWEKLSAVFTDKRLDTIYQNYFHP
jgi:hypothetical protein